MQNPSGVSIKNTATLSCRLAFFSGITGNKACVPLAFALQISRNGHCAQSGFCGLHTNAPNSNKLCVNALQSSPDAG
jgi:hypothetical protein